MTVGRIGGKLENEFVHNTAYCRLRHSWVILCSAIRWTLDIACCRIRQNMVISFCKLNKVEIHHFVGLNTWGICHVLSPDNCINTCSWARHSLDMASFKYY